MQITGRDDRSLLISMRNCAFNTPGRPTFIKIKDDLLIGHGDDTANYLINPSRGDDIVTVHVLMDGNDG